MAAIIPQKRSTSPAPPTSTDPDLSPSSSKQPRLDAKLPSDAAGSDVKKRGKRVPKGFRGKGDSGPMEMGESEKSYLSTQFEVDDSTEYQGALLALEGLIAKSAYPTRQHIRQILSLCFFPLLFKPPTRVSAFARTTSSARTKPVLPSFDQDPFNLSHKKIREEARKILDDLIATNGVEVVCRSIRGYGIPKLPKSSSPTTLEDPFESTSINSSPVPSTTFTKSMKTNTKGGGRGKGKQKATSAPPSNSDEDLSLSDSDDVLAISAKRIGQTENLWDFLAGTMAKKPRVPTREQPILDGGWEILRSCVEGWRVEFDKKKETAFATDSPIQPISLLRYFKPSATSSIARELSSKALDVAFWPFTDSALPKSQVESNDSDGESDASSLFSDDDYKGKGKGKAKVGSKAKAKEKQEDEEEPPFEGGMSLEEKKEVGVKLLCLIGELSTTGHLDGTATLAEFVQRIKALDHSSFPTLLELLSLHSSPSSPFLPRLLITYLESHSHPLSASVALDVPSLASLSSSTLAATSSADHLTSPRKRALAASSSLSSMPTDTQSQQSQSHGNTPTLPTQTLAQVEAEFWKTPDLESKEMLVLVSRIPIEVPLPRTTSAEAGGGGRKAKGLVVSTERSARAAECHRLVKEVLLDRKFEESEARGRSQEERNKWIRKAREVLQGVEEVVEQAKQRK
ncbi:uncharacterized protein JCM6883_004875 [Sporobolomyces salmoneus]|uniref:uncharacterized protein n=1 Tax=Sporobolomyces salmoneus TaxID=183962 RepID=UPI003172937C